LYGLELRAVTAALNASILPIAVRTAAYVEQGVRDAGIAATVMVMRGDGGATDLAGFREAPARTLYSGPAASVAGALRTGGITEEGDHAWSPSAHQSALEGFRIAGERCRLDGLEVARRMMSAASEAVCEQVHELVSRQKLRDPMIVAVGGGAGALGRHVASR